MAKIVELIYTEERVGDGTDDTKKSFAKKVGQTTVIDGVEWTNVGKYKENS